MGDLIHFLELNYMKTNIYSLFMVQLKNSFLMNFGAEIPVKLWNRGPF